MYTNLSQNDIEKAIKTAEQYENIDLNKLLQMLSDWAKSSEYNYWSGYWIYHKTCQFASELM